MSGLTYHDGGVERLEVKDHNRVCVESGLRLQGEGYTLRGLHAGSLVDTRGNWDVVHRLGNTKHH